MKRTEDVKVHSTINCTAFTVGENSSTRITCPMTLYKVKFGKAWQCGTEESSTRYDETRVRQTRWDSDLQVGEATGPGRSMIPRIRENILLPFYRFQLFGRLEHPGTCGYIRVDILVLLAPQHVFASSCGPASPL